MIKARDIYNMYNNNSFGYEMYLYLPQTAEGKTLELTSKLKAYADSVRLLRIQYLDERMVDLSKVKCDIKRDGNMWINLRLRKFNILNVDNFSELVLDHFNFDDDKLVFVFTYKGGVL